MTYLYGLWWRSFWKVHTGGASRLEVYNTGTFVNNNLFIADKIGHTGDSNTYMGFPFNDTINWYTNGGERMRIDSSGNVGIGTTSPAEKLDVNGNIQVGDRLLATPSNWGYASSYKTLILGSSGTDYTTDAVTISFGVDVSSNTNSSFTGNGSELLFRNAAHFTTPNSDDTAYLSLMSFNDGNVGIGTTSPDYKLHINGTVGITEYLYHSGDNNTYLRFSGDRIIFQAGGYEMLRLIEGTTSEVVINEGSQNLNFRVESDTDTHALFVQGSDGNVGIGTASPTEKLHVSGNVRIEGDLTVNGSYTQIDTDVNTTEQWNVTNDGTGPAVTINQTGSQDIMDVQDDGTSVFYIEDGGNIGVGTTDPASILHISSSTPILTIEGTRNDIRLIETDTTDTNTLLRHQTSLFRIDTINDAEDTITRRFTIDHSDGSVQFNNYGSNSFTGTAAYALAVDSSGNVIETAVQGSPTGGSGTAGKITKWDTSSTLTDSVITESSGNIGIGTASPSFPVHIVNASTSYVAAETTGTGTSAGFRMKGDSNADYTLFTTQGTNQFAIYDNANTAQRLTITSSGNVGIGTTSPSSKLEVSGSSLTELKVTESGSSVTTMVQSSTSYGWVGTKTNHTMYIGANDGAKITVLANGNVGIGITNPSRKLQVDSASGYPLSVNSTQQYLMEFARGGVSEWWIAVNNGDFKFHENGVGDQVIIKAGGNVGIGTTSPSTKLYVDGGESTFNRGNSDGAIARFRGKNAEKAVIGTVDSWFSSNVGIGTTSPGSTLHVDGNVRFVNSGFAGFEAHNTNGTWESFIGTETGGGGNRYNSASSQHTFYNNSTAVMRINSSGNVGIGTSTPDRQLQVHESTSGTSTAKFTNSTTGEDGDTGFFVGINGSEQPILYGYNNTDMIIGTNGSERMRIASDGNVGIGTTSPGAKLHIHHTSEEVLRIDSGTTGAIHFFENTTRRGILGYSNGTSIATAADAGDMVLRAESGSKLHLGIAGTSRLTVSGSNIGIGTTNPVEDLHVVGDIRSDRFIITDTGNVGRLTLDIDANDDTVITTGTTNGTRSLLFLTETAERMRITSSGRLGIGTTNPAYHIHGLSAESGWGYSFQNATGDEDVNVYMSHGGGYGIAVDSTENTSDKYLLKLSGGTGGGTGIGSVTRMIVTAAGNVGIGTTSPNQKLHLYGGNISIDNSSDVALIFAKSGASKYEWYLDNVANNFGLYDRGNSAWRFNVTNSGNVGIGITNPLDKLQVQGNVAVPSGVIYNGAASNSAGLGLNNAYFDASGYYGIRFFSSLATVGSQTERMRITNTGNVGIGTTSPGDYYSSKLVVNAGNEDGITIVGGTSDINYLMFADGTVGNARYRGMLWYQHSTDTMAFSTSGSNRMYITNTGNVGIGTTSPSEKLEVNGNVKANSFIAAKDAGIYIFSDTVDASSSEDIFSISNNHGSQAFRVTFVCNTSGYSVAKTFEVVHSYGNDPVFFKVVDTGAFSGRDFDVSFTNSNTDTGVTCEITNNSTDTNADITTTVFLGGSPTAITVTAL